MNEVLLKKCQNFDFKKLFLEKGYSYFEKGDFNINIIGVRSKVQGNTFNDALIIDYKEKGVWKRFLASITTIPGVYYLNHPLGKDGTGILKCGQYPHVWKIDKHQGKYDALCQRGNEFIVYRDNNKDSKIDFKEASLQHGYFGINLHCAGIDSTYIDKWSAACQVCQRKKDFNAIMVLANKAKSLYGNSFTYTLLNEQDLK